MRLTLFTLILILSFSGCVGSVENLGPQKTKSFENSVKNMDEKDRQSLMDKLVPLFISYENNRGQ